jgi:hypothetical protein
MQPNKSFAGLPKEFWANIRTIGQEVGYTVKSAGQAGQIKVPTLAEIKDALEAIHLTSKHLVGEDAKPTDLGKRVIAYFEYRAGLLNREVEPLLMNSKQAAKLYQEFRQKYKGGVAAPVNKKTGKKKTPAYFTAIINMLIEANLEGLPCNYNPQELTTITRNREPLRTLARRVDGTFPAPVNPIAVWEIKEYYHTTTFGSRIADGVYESLLDGMELEELDAELCKLAKGQDRPARIQHLLMVDAHGTWWSSGGRPYLCRIIDMLNMGHVDEVLFGKEVVTRLPTIVKGWVAEYRRLNG